MYTSNLLAAALALASNINAQVDIGSAASFGVLGGTTVTNTGDTFIDGDVGVYPGTAITGLSAGTSSSGEFHNADAESQYAQEDVKAAYDEAAALTPTVDLTGEDLGSETLAAGVYYFADSAELAGDLVLDGGNNTSSVWVFQIGSTLTTGASSSVTLVNGALACNVFWQVGSSATIAQDTEFAGYVLALVSITVVSGASSEGGFFANTGAVTLDTNSIQAASV